MSKLMELAAKEIFRKEIMQLCSQAAPIGCSMEVLNAALAHSGQAGRGELLRQVDYLEQKGMVTVKEVGNSRLGISRKIVSITADGTDYLEGSMGGMAGIGEQDG